MTTINTKRKAPVSTTTLPVLMEAIADPLSSASRVADVVSRDPGLSSRVLGLANSAEFGLSRTVARLDLAIGLVGTSMVQTLAIASATALLDRGGPLGDRPAHALQVAGAARLLAPRADVAPADAFAAGLLHDVGELLLLQARPSEYAALYPTFTNHAAQLAAEREAFNTDHALCGAEHLLDWRVPDVIADAVADHHEPFADSAACTIVVAAADELITADPEARHALDLLDVDAELAEGLRSCAVAESAELVSLLAA